MKTKNFILITILFFITILVSGCTQISKIGNESLFEPREEVTITTDKTTYERGEKIEVAIKNNSGKDVWYMKEIKCGLSFWQLEKKVNGLWKNRSWGKICDWETYPSLIKLPNNGTDSNVWDQSSFGLDYTPKVFIEKGIYRFSFHYWDCSDPSQSHEYMERGRISEECWKNIYSNEFTIDENCSLLEEQIREKIKQANHCTVDSDCVVYKKIFCPFGCYFLFNKNIDETEIWENFEEYSQNCPPRCVFDCFLTPNVEDIKCMDNKCIIINR